MSERYLGNGDLRSLSRIARSVAGLLVLVGGLSSDIKMLKNVGRAAHQLSILKNQCPRPSHAQLRNEQIQALKDSGSALAASAAAFGAQAQAAADPERKARWNDAAAQAIVAAQGTTTLYEHAVGSASNTGAHPGQRPGLLS